MILVTGATGLTGKFVVEELLRRGHTVRVLCRAASFSKDAWPAAVEVAIGDLCQPETLVDAARGADGIVHTACTYTDSTLDIAAMQALLASWTTGPFVFVSTLDVYGFAPSSPVTEDTPVTETFNDYGRGKVICERLLAEAADRTGRADFVSLRAPYIWGSHPIARKRLRVQRLLEHRAVVLPGADHAEWSQHRAPWIDARDLATIIAESMTRPAGGPLNVATDHASWHEVYAELIRWTGSRSEIVHKPIDAITDDELPKKHVYAETSHFSEERLAQHLGSIPRRSLETTLRDTVTS